MGSRQSAWLEPSTIGLFRGFDSGRLDQRLSRGLSSAYIGNVPGADPRDLAALPLFDALSESELAEVAAWFEARDVGNDVKLVGEGTTGHSFFVIVDGGVSITAGGDEIATLGSGDFFGELALLATGRRTATVTTTKPSRLLVLFGNDFTRLRAQYPAIAAELEVTVEERLQRP